MIIHLESSVLMTGDYLFLLLFIQLEMKEMNAKTSNFTSTG
jgi:hypothetical protein